MWKNDKSIVKLYLRCKLQQIVHQYNEGQDVGCWSQHTGDSRWPEEEYTQK